MAVTIVQSASGIAGGGGLTLTLGAAVTAGNVLVEVCAKRNGGTGAVIMQPNKDNSIGPQRAFTIPTAAVGIRAGDIAGADGLSVGWRVASGDEQTLYWGVQNQHVMLYEVAGLADPNLAQIAVLSKSFQGGSTSKSLGTYATGREGDFCVAGFLIDSGSVDQSVGTSWTEDYNVPMSGGGHPTMVAMHAFALISPQITGAAVEWGGVALSFPAAAPRGHPIGGPSLLIEYFDNNSSTFGPSTLRGVIHDALSVGWSWYSRYPANAFFTLRATSVHNARLVPLLTHLRITYYNPRTGHTKVVFTGRLTEPDQTGDDVIWTAWNYLSELSLSRTGYRVMYQNKKIGTEIAAVEWNLAKTASHSLLNHIVTGTIEDPLGIDAVTPIKTDSRFGVIDVPRLLLMFDLTEIGRANTLNNVTMGISREAPFTFTFLKNAGTAITGRRLTMPGAIRGFHYVPGYAALRNDLATIGTGPDGSANEIVKTDEANATTYGRRQDVFTIKTLAGSAAGATEADAQQAITARAVKEATRLSKSLLLDVRPELVEPFKGYDIEDTLHVEINRGQTVIADDYRVIGVRGLLDQNGYHPQLYVQLPTT